MAINAKRAKRTDSRLRIGFVGPSGTGKTYTALRIARALVGETGRILVVDTERGSASLYADMPQCAGEFDVIELDSFAPDKFIEAIEYADDHHYDVCIIDSLSHAWMGKDGALEMVDVAAARSRAGNNFAAWREVTPVHNRMVDTILRARCHMFVTMRAKTEWVVEKDEKGKNVPRKVGMQPVQRDGMEYEFTIVGDMDDSNTWIVTKDRTSRLMGKVWKKPGADVAEVLRDWMSSASQPDPVTETPPAPDSGGRNGNGAPKQAEIPPAPTESPEASIALTVYKEVVRLAQSIAFQETEVKDMYKNMWNAKSAGTVSVATANEIKRDMALKATLFVQIKSAVLAVHFEREGFEPDSQRDQNALIDKTIEVLRDKAALDYASRPLRAKASAWQEWLGELNQKATAAA